MLGSNPLSGSGLVRFRINLESTSRRGFLKSAVAAGAAAAWSLRPDGARAATPITWLGWQGYDAALAADYLAKRNLALETTYISDSAEIITKIRLSMASSISARPISSMSISWRAKGCWSRSIWPRFPISRSLFRRSHSCRD